MISTPIYFEATDKVKLFGILSLPENFKKNEVLISIHGQASNCTKDREQIIGKFLIEKNIPYFCFNNRGSEILTRKKKFDGKKFISIKGGAMYEKISESVYDILGAINFLKKQGFKKFYLMGHSLGCTKIVYFYSQMIKTNNNVLKDIKKVLLLSPVDIAGFFENENKNLARKSLKKAIKLMKKNKKEELVESGMDYNISAETFIESVDPQTSLISYGENSNYLAFNQIQVPLFIRFGTESEMIVQSPEKIVSLLKEKIENKFLDVNFIKGANHSYEDKEKILAKQIYNFIVK